MNMPKFTELRHASAVVALFLAAALVSAQAPSKKDNDNIEVKSPLGELHMGTDPHVRDLGLPVYPGAQLREHDQNKDNANLSILTYAFGMKLLVMNYDSADSTSKLVAYYREKMKMYGRVVECHITTGGDVNLNDHGKQDSGGSKDLKCDDDNSGGAVELKAGTEDDQHIVEIEPAETGKGSAFTLIYLRQRGKQTDI